MIRAARHFVLGLLFVPLAMACGESRPAPVTITQQEVLEPGQLPDSSRIVVVALGDSLTAGLGLLSEEAYPTVLQHMFAAEGYPEVEVVNAGVSGDTTAGGLRRAPATIEPATRIAIVALGGNDALRGLAVRQTRENLKGIIDFYLENGVDVLLAGMYAPTNLGADYQTAFANTYASLAAEYQGKIRHVPFLLEGVAGRPDLNQADGIHPNAAGARRIAELLYPPLRDMVNDLPPAPAQ
jgi:acyl-CoA thioesterase-1